MIVKPGEKPDISERGRDKDGNSTSSDVRLFMQLLVFTGAGDDESFAAALMEAKIPGVLYRDTHDPEGLGLLTFSDNPDFFVTELRELLNQKPFSGAALEPEFTMFGRTYAIGHESDLHEWLIEKPKRTALNPEWPWAIWYPLRRHGSFAKLEYQDQRRILGEHGAMGHAFGRADYAHDIRLACYGLDKNDNDFVIGLTGKDLYPLSATIQAMRSTQQTSEYIESLGPFFIGKAVWQSAV